MPDDPPPQPPQKPEPADCCGGGCITCVYDFYEAALERYEQELAQWRARQPAGRGNAADEGQS